MDKSGCCFQKNEHAIKEVDDLGTQGQSALSGIVFYLAAHGI